MWKELASDLNPVRPALCRCSSMCWRTRYTARTSAAYAHTPATPTGVLKHEEHDPQELKAQQHTSDRRGTAPHLTGAASTSD